MKITDKIEVSPQEESILKKLNNFEDYKKEIESHIGKDTTQLIAALMGGGVFLGGSDIHLEPEETCTRLRLRMDGMLHDIMDFEPEAFRSMLSRLKLLSGLKLNVHDKPQDGSFSIVFKNLEIEIRVSSLPSEYGESIVMRILNPQSLKNLEDLGLRPDLLERFQAEIKKPNGMIIVTGPTGSGKTTTLYAFLKHIHQPEIKIITIEDPIEYRLNGISQTQIDQKKGYTFAEGLRSIVRQDPDVILVGEIRDQETAEISLQSALTGHLVFSTLHTNDAAGTIPRLTSLGADPVNIGPAINMVIAQRLIRKVCQECRTVREATPEEKEIIDRGLEGLPKDIIPDRTNGYLVSEPKGCKVCNNTGYKGRVGIFESFIIETQIESMILHNPAIPDIKKTLKKSGFINMYQDGLIKVLNRETTISEIVRVTKEN